MTRLFAVLIAVVLLLVTALPQGARAQSANDIVWVQIEAHGTLAVATQRAQAFAASVEDVNGFALPGGWYGIALGPYRRADAEIVLRSYRRDRLIPADSYIVGSDTFRQQFWPVGANVLNRGSVEAPVTTTQTAEPAETPTEETPAAQPTPPDETVAEARRSERALSAEERKDLQIALQWAGYYNAAIDGAFGRGTRGSMSAWQEANGYEATGVLTTLQRAALIQQYNAVLDGLDLRVVQDARAGIQMALPMAEVRFAKVEPPFVHYDSAGDIGARVLLISQAGDRNTLFGLYDIMQTLEIVPLDGPRERRNNSFTLTGSNSRIVSHTEASLDNGQIKGFTLIWPAGDEERRTRVLDEMRASFTRIPGVLDPAAGSDAEQSIDLVSGLQIRQPKISRSGFFLEPGGTVVTTTEVVGSCDRVTVDGDTEADVLVQDATNGVALVKPRAPLAPLATARLATREPRLQSDVSVAGYSYEGVLSAATLTFGKVADVKGLRGEETVNRLTLTAQPGDAGGPIFDATGTVVGMLLPRSGADQQLPEDVSFAVESSAIADLAAGANVSVVAGDSTAAIAPRDLRIAAQGMTVLVSCWE